MKPERNIFIAFILNLLFSVFGGGGGAGGYGGGFGGGRPMY